MTTLLENLLEFDARFACEAYPRVGESLLAVLKRGDFQHNVPTLLRYRTYELDDNGEQCNFGEWVKAEGKVGLGSFYE